MIQEGNFYLNILSERRLSLNTVIVGFSLLIEIATVAVVTFVFFVSAKKQTNMKLVTTTSLICAIVWYLCYFIFIHFIYQLRLSVSEVFSMTLISSSLFRSLSFFAGAALLGQ